MQWTYSFSQTRLSDDSRVVRFTMGDAYFYGHDRDCLFVMETPAASSAASDSERITNRTLAGTTVAKLDEAVRDATAAGYRVVAGCDGKLELMLEKTRPPLEPHRSLILGAKRAATMQRELNEAGLKGSRLLPAAIGVYMKEVFGTFEGLQTETYAVMEKDPRSNDRYEYRVVTGQAQLDSASVRGYEFVAMMDLFLSASAVVMEKRLPPGSSGP